VEYFSSLGSRVAGYPGADSAAAYIERQFRELGLQSVRAEVFQVAVPIDDGAFLELPDGTRLTLNSIWPNLVRTSAVPLEGLRGVLVDGGSGHLDEFDGAPMVGSVVLLEFNSWNRWLDAAMLGAAAILFVEPDSTTYVQAAQKFLQVPLRTPRFWIARAEARALRSFLQQQPEPPAVVLHGHMRWQRRSTRNIVGVLPGADPDLRDEIVLLEAYYDGMSVVPALAPAAEMACSAAALLEVARHLSRDPPGRTVVFAATSAHHLALAGMSAFLQRHSRTEPHYAALVEDPIAVKLAVSLDLSSHTDELAIWNSSTDLYQRRYFAPFGSAFTRMADELGPAIGYDTSPVLYNGITPVGGLAWNSLMPGGDLRSNSQLALEAGIPALAFVTVNDARLVVDTPLDRVRFVNFANLTRQTQLLSVLLQHALSRDDLFPTFRMRLKDKLRGLHGRVLTFPRRSIAPDRPRPDAIIAMRTGSTKSAKGVRETFYQLADQNGEYEIHGVRALTAQVEAYYLDPEDGEIRYAPNRGVQAKIYKPDVSLNRWLTESTSILFPCVATDFFDAVDPRFLNRLAALQVYDETNNEPREYGYSLGIGSDEPVGVLFSTPGERLKLTMSQGLMGIRFMLLNAEGDLSQAGQGSGYPVDRPGAFIHTSYLAARDMWALNEARIRKMMRFGISNRRVTQLHDEAGRRIQSAATALENQQWSEFIKLSRAALGLEARAYPDVTATQNDVVHGVVFFMALMIPCAFFCERLLIGAADIHYQIGGFAVIFAAIWICISLVHPAFELSNPLVVLLAFIILALAVFVLVLVLSQFNAYMREVDPDAVFVHDTDISRIGACYTAFILGISNMRRRKLRTALTFITLLLLTFTVLSFTSIETSLHFSRVQLPHRAAYAGGLIRSRTWAPLPESTFDYARADFFDRAAVAPRSWYAPAAQNLIPIRQGDHVVHARGILGLTPAENAVSGFDHCLTAGAWFTDEREASCLLPVHLAQLLSIGPDQVGVARVRVFGENLLVRGLFDPGRVRQLLDLDGEPMTPVNFSLIGGAELQEARQQDQLTRQEQGPPSVDLVSFTHLDGDEIIVLPYQLLRELGGSLQSVGMRFHEPASTRVLIEDFLSRLGVTIFAGLPDDVSHDLRAWTYNSLGVTAFGGLGDQLVPVLIASLIVLNTMMGSVYERFREIGIYSSVGLAPVHISFLFIAEACVYAVLGVVGGYLVGQVTAKILLWQGWLGAISLNYSSLAAVTAASLVMGLVLVSSWYPAHIAGRLAVPDVTRRWRLPEPEGDRWEFLFPFTVSRLEVLELCSFLAAYLEAYGEESTSTFYTRGTQLRQVGGDTDESCEVRTRLWLAPFDLGVSEDLLLKASPTGEQAHEVYEISLVIERRSGEPASWRRTNQRFVNILRKQFLIWRTLPAGVKHSFQERYESEEA